MNVYINESEVDKSLISFNTGLNYGRFDYEGLIIENYRIILSVAEFIDTIQSEYLSIRDEIKLDDDAQNETSAFTAINYGSISALLNNNNNEPLQNIMTTYLDKIFFSKLFSQSNNSRFIINSTEVIELKNDTIEINGRTFKKL